MRGLAIGLRTWLAFLPVGLESVARTAVGPRSAWRWLPPAVPWLLAAATAAAVAALALATLQTATDYPALVIVAGAILGAVVGVSLLGLARPGGSGLAQRLAVAASGATIGGILGGIFSTPIIDAPVVSSVSAGVGVGLLVLGRRLQIARSARAAAASIELVPTVIASLLLLATVPVIAAGAELIITRATPVEFVERRVGGSSLVETDGLALLAPFEAESPIDPERGPDAALHHWYALRAEPGDRRIALVRSTLDLSALRRRTVVARLINDHDAVRAAAAALGARGVPVDPSLGDRLLVSLGREAAAMASDVRPLGSLAELATQPAGSVVRLTLDFPGEGVATCVVTDNCLARRLGDGVGPWDHLATQPGGGGSVLVRANYPPSLAPMRVIGRQTTDPGAVGRFVALPWIRSLLGWAQVLRAAIIQHDLTLPVDRLWLGPILFVGLAAALGLGRRIGYPIFAGEPMAVGRWSGPAAGMREIRATATGRLAPPGRSALDLVETVVVLRPAVAGPSIEVPARGGAIVVAVPRALGALSSLERGDLRFVRGRRPALRASWYGSSVELIFASDGDRDAAAALLHAAL